MQVENLQIEFSTEEGTLRAVDGISFSIEEGKILGIVGESGCGKSVTALSLMRLLREPPAKICGGRIQFKEKEILSLTPEELRSVRGAEMGIIFQEPMTSLNPVFTIGSQITEAIAAHDSKLSSGEIRARVIQLLELVGIPDPGRRFDDYPHELSGGMRQRVMIAMALSCRPKLLIADEPTTALDVTIQAQILDLIRRLQKETGMSVILITHDLGIVAETADDVLVMYAGKIVERARVNDLFRNPLHPYSQGLLDSVPKIGTFHGAEPLKGIPGALPDLRRLPMGCRFQDRCAKVVPACRQSEPLLEEKGPGHFAACFEVPRHG